MKEELERELFNLSVHSYALKVRMDWNEDELMPESYKGMVRAIRKMWAIIGKEKKK